MADDNQEASIAAVKVEMESAGSSSDEENLKDINRSTFDFGSFLGAGRVSQEEVTKQVKEFMKRRATVSKLDHERNELSKTANYLQGATNGVKTVQDLNEKVKKHKEQKNEGMPDVKEVIKTGVETKTITNKYVNEMIRKAHNAHIGPQNMSPLDQFKCLEGKDETDDYFAIREEMHKQTKDLMKKYIKHHDRAKTEIEFENVEFCCEKCNPVHGQYMTEIKLLSQARYMIVVKCYDHMTQSLCILLYMYYLDTGVVEYVRRLELCTPIRKEEKNCLSVFYVSYVTQEDYLYYFESKEDDDSYTLTCKRINLEDQGDIEDYQTAKIPKSGEYNDHVVSVLLNKPYVSQMEENKEGIDDRTMTGQLNIDDYTVTVFYVNGDNETDSKMEIRKLSNLEECCFEKRQAMNLTGDLYATQVIKENAKLDSNISVEECPDQLLVVSYSDNVDQRYLYLKLSDDEITRAKNTNGDIIKTQTSNQKRLQDNWKYICEEINEEINYFALYKYQWYYKIMTEFCPDGKLRNFTKKRKNRSVFVSMNNFAKDHLDIECRELGLQKLNFVYDMKHGKIVFLLMKDPTGKKDNHFNQLLWQINISNDQRTQCFEIGEISDFNYYLQAIFDHELSMNSQLSWSRHFSNLLRTNNSVYCFDQKHCVKVSDPEHKYNNYHPNFLYEIDSGQYIKYSRESMKEYMSGVKQTQNMFVQLRNDFGEINSTLFLQYNGGSKPTDSNGVDWDEYVLAWNPKVKITEGDNVFPIIINRKERMKRIRNSFQIKLQLLNFHEAPEDEVPFVGIKYHELGDTSKIKSLWLSVLNYNQKNIEACHQIDVNEQEIKNIKEIKFCKNVLIDETQKQGTDFVERLPDDCKKQQNYQVLIWMGDDKWISKILEYRIRWWKNQQKNGQYITIELISQKLLIGEMLPNDVTLIEQAVLFPLFDNSMQVTGTQLNFKVITKNEDGFVENQPMVILNLDNFNKSDYQFKNKYCYFGHKQYNFTHYGARKFILVESRLRENIIQAEMFTDYDKSLLLNNSVISVLNHVPFKLEAYLHLEASLKPRSFNFFQPLELINGTSQAALMIDNPSQIKNNWIIQMEDNHFDHKHKEWFYQSLAENIVSSEQQKDWLLKLGYIPKMVPDMQSLLTPLHYCYELKNLQAQSSHILIDGVMKDTENAEYNQVLLTQILSKCIDMKKVSHKLYPFFITNNESLNNHSHIMNFEKYFDHNLLPRGSDDRRKMYSFNPTHISTKCLENNMFDLIMAHEKDIEGQEYVINYSFVDLRPMNFQRKMDQILKFSKNIDDVKCTSVQDEQQNSQQQQLSIKYVSDTDLQMLFESVVWNSEEQLEVMHGMQKVIDKVFLQDTQKFFTIQTIVYIMFFVIPFMFAEFSDGQEIEGAQGFALTIATITQIAFFVIECMEIFELKYQYFESIWNYFDILLFASWFAYFGIKSQEGYKGDAILYDNVDGTHDKNAYHYTDDGVIFNVLKCFVIVMSFLKIIGFCRVFEGFASLVMLLTTVLGDLWYFQIFFFLMIILFTFLQWTLSVQYNGNGYTDVSPGWALFLQTFENAMGNIQAPGYPNFNWKESTETEFVSAVSGKHVVVSPFLEGVQIVLIWSIWFLTQYFALVIMLNFLISVITDTYTSVTERRVMHSYRFRNELNIEYLKLKDRFLWMLSNPTVNHCMLLVTSNDDYNTTLDDDDVKSDIINSISNSKKETQSKISNLNDRMSDLETAVEDIKSFVTEMQSN